MTPADLAEIEARLNAATPGPWRLAIACDEYGQDESKSTVRAGYVDVCMADNADATFIAHAPTDIAALLAEVRRLTPTAKVARWGAGGVLNYRYTVLRANNNRTIAKYGYDECRGHDPWLAWIGANPTRFPTEPEARAHIAAWAKSKGWEVRDGG